MVYEAFSTSDVTVILKTPSKERADNQRTAESNAAALAGAGRLVSTSFPGFTVDVLPDVKPAVGCLFLLTI